MSAVNSPGAIFVWVLLPVVGAAVLAYAWLAISAWCAASVARSVECALARSRELPQQLELDDDPPDPAWLARTRDVVVEEARRGGYVRPSRQEQIDELRAMWSAPTYQRRTR